MTGFSTLYRVEGCAAAIPGDHRQSLHPVSYTHLDVYKRQDYKRTLVYTQDTMLIYRQGNTTLMMFQYPLSGRRLCSTAATSPSPVP